jgi:hypothetical protein
VFKEEVIRLRQELAEMQQREHNKSVALGSLADFFNNHTMPKVKDIMTGGAKEEESDEEIVKD